MAKYRAYCLVAMLFVSSCLADTFINRKTGDSFNGYVLQKKKGNKTQVRLQSKSIKYLILNDYQVQRNYMGRRNKVYIISIKESIEYIYETEAFEKAIRLAAGQGPLFIIIQIDTPGGRIDLAQRISTAITNTDNCTTVAYITGKKFGGAFSAGAIVAIACDKIFMRQGTAIGAAAAYIRTPTGPKTVEEVYGRTIGEKLNSAWLGYTAALAQRTGRPSLLVKAMVDADLQVVEVRENGKRFFVPEKTDPNQTVVHTWSKPGSLLTLTADEAARTGLADEVVASQDQILALLDATRATQTPDRTIAKARTVFLRVKRRIDKYLSAIDSLQQQAASVTQELDTVEAEIRRINEILRGNYSITSTNRYDFRDLEYQLDAVFFDRDDLFDQLLDVLEDLIRNYRRALPIAKKHVDFKLHAETIEENLESTRDRYTQLTTRPRLLY